MIDYNNMRTWLRFQLHSASVHQWHQSWFFSSDFHIESPFLAFILSYDFQMKQLAIMHSLKIFSLLQGIINQSLLILCRDVPSLRLPHSTKNYKSLTALSTEAVRELHFNPVFGDVSPGRPRKLILPGMTPPRNDNRRGEIPIIWHEKVQFYFQGKFKMAGKFTKLTSQMQCQIPYAFWVKRVDAANWLRHFFTVRHLDRQLSKSSMRL